MGYFDREKRLIRSAERYTYSRRDREDLEVGLDDANAFQLSLRGMARAVELFDAAVFSRNLYKSGRAEITRSIENYDQFLPAIAEVVLESISS